MKPNRGNRGAALVLVLWLVAALSLTVLAGARGIRQQTQQATFDIERLRAQQLLDTARQVVVQHLMTRGDKNQAYDLLHLQLDPYNIQIEITPSTGLIDINVANEALIQALLHRVGGLTTDQALIMGARIKDYIDIDDQPTGAGGAEAAQYRAAGWPTLPRNGALDDLTELRNVLGMTPELYDIIAPYLGLNGQQNLQVNAVAPPLIDALTGQPGLGARLHATPPEMRLQLLPSSVAAEFFAAPNSGSSGNNDVFKIISTLEIQPGHLWQRQAWVELRTRPQANTPWTALSLEPTQRVTPTPQDTPP